MAELIIEILTRNGAHAAFHKVERLPVTIGRAFDNDLILPDPYVSPRHLVIEAGSENCIAIDQGSENGTFLLSSGKIEAPTELASGSRLLVGRTVIRVWSPSHIVPGAQPSAQIPRKEHHAVPVISVLSILVTGAFVTLLQFLNVAKETKPMALIANALPLLIFPFLWAGIWASAGFIVRRRGNFGTQLIIANIAFMLILIFAGVAEYVDYFTCSVKAGNLFQYACMAILASLALFQSLKTATGNARFKRALLSLVIGTGIVAAIAVTEHADTFEKSIAPDYSQTLKPPYVKIAKSANLDSFIKESKRLFVDKKTGTEGKKR
jgi:hypothetical protein